MSSINVKLLNEAGLHARPASLFVKLAQEFDSDIFVEKEGTKVDGKAILGILSLGAASGSTITITAEGQDEEKAINDLKELIENGFNE